MLNSGKKYLLKKMEKSTCSNKVKSLALWLCGQPAAPVNTQQLLTANKNAAKCNTCCLAFA